MLLDDLVWNVGPETRWHAIDVLVNATTLALEGQFETVARVAVLAVATTLGF